MKQITFISIALVALIGAVFAQAVPVITVDGAINPVSSDYIMRCLKDAVAESAPCIVLRLDTPGGLMSTTEDITRAFMASEIPVITYVWPTGGRAASAGVFIAYASHIVAMAPGTRIGAAHPVDMMGGSGTDSAAVMMEKVTNDAIANLRAIAAERGRNPGWAERAVRHSESLTNEEAVTWGVSDFTANDINELLAKLDGYVFGQHNGDTLRLPNPVPVEKPMTSVERFLFTILNPNITYLLLMLGIVGVYLELQNPGTIVPGVVGGISLLLAFYAFQMLPVNYVGVALILLAVVLFIAETQTSTFGLLTTGGVIAMLAGSFLLTSGNADLFVISWKVIIPTVIVAALLIAFAVYKAAQARFSKPVTGNEGLVGEEGVVTKRRLSNSRATFVQVHGELWIAVGDDLQPGDHVVVEKVIGNKVIVRKK
jgi:membrane-bound serine protease (ClpP class)